MRTPRVRRRSPRCCPGCCSTSRLYAVVRNKVLVDGALGTHLAGNLMMGFGLLSVVVAAFFLSRQKDVKRLFAYSSIEHMGIVTFAFGMGGPVASFAGLLHMTAHSLTKSAIFFAVGPCRAEDRHPGDRRHPRPDPRQPGGRLGADAGQHRHPGHAAVRRVRQRVPDPDHGDARAALGHAVPADRAGRGLCGHLQQGAGDGVRRDDRAAACRIRRPCSRCSCTCSSCCCSGCTFRPTWRSGIGRPRR